MGLVQSKKDGVIRKFQLKIHLTADILKDLLGLTNWSFRDIKGMYDSYCRKTDCPYIQFFTFHKILPFSTDVSRVIFNIYSDGQKYINIFEFISMLILTSHNNYRKKLHFIYVMFDFYHAQMWKNRQLLFVFECLINGFCRFTGQKRPNFDYLSKYIFERFIRTNTLQAMQKQVNYRRLIQQVQGNNDAFDLFKRFDQEIYNFMSQQSYLFRVNQYKKYDKEDMEKIYRIIRKVNSQKNYEEIEMVQKNRRFRLENRKIKGLQKLLEDKQMKFKTPLQLKMRSQSLAHFQYTQKIYKESDRNYQPSSPGIHPNTSGILSKIKFIKKQQMVLPKLQQIKQKASSNSNKPLKKILKKVLILNGKITNKEDIFQTIKYFKNLSGNKKEIKIKQFFKSFDKKAFFKKQVSSLFQFFDQKKKGEISFEDFLKVYYENITHDDILTIKEWYCEYKNIHEADHFDIDDYSKKKEKKNGVQLPISTVKRIQEIFDSFDRTKKGYLTFEDLKAGFSGFTIKEIQDIFRDFGQNNKLYMNQFIRMTLPEDWTIQGTNYVGS